MLGGVLVWETVGDGGGVQRSAEVGSGQARM